MTRFQSARALLLCLAVAAPSASPGQILNGFGGPGPTPAFEHPCFTGIRVEAPQAGQVNSSVQCGASALAAGFNATAFGANSLSFNGGTAIGNSTLATGADATALGRGATATYDNSTAIGANSVTTAPNQVALGGPGTSVRVGDIAASTAAQERASVGVATVDANGTLGRDTTILPAIQTLQSASSSQAGQISALQASAAAQAGRITAIEGAQAMLSGRVDSLYDLRASDRREMRQGVAVATAMGQAHFPSAPGRTSYVFNIATFRGEQAVGGSIMHRVAASVPLAIGAGFSHAGGRNTAARVGVAGEF